MYHTACTYKTI